jgi:hypothetical protein
MTMNIKVVLKLLSFALTLSIVSCSPAFRANIDDSLSGRLVWPGPPEEPRIQYVWTIYSFVPEGDHMDSQLTPGKDCM